MPGARTPPIRRLKRMRRATYADIDILAAIHDAAFPPADAWSGDVFGLQLALPNVFGLLHAVGRTDPGSESRWMRRKS